MSKTVNQQFLSSIYKGDVLDTLSLIQAYEFEPHQCADSRGYTALHIAALNANYRMAHFLVLHTQRTHEHPAETLKTWANQQTDEMFSPLHFACFKGCIV